MKKYFKISILLFFLFAYICCQRGNEINYIKKLKSVYDLNYPRDFKVTWYEMNSGDGDYDDSFELTFSENGFKKIADQMDTLKLGRVSNVSSSFFVHRQIKENEFKEVSFNFKKKTVVYTHGVL